MVSLRHLDTPRKEVMNLFGKKKRWLIFLCMHFAFAWVHYWLLCHIIKIKGNDRGKRIENEKETTVYLSANTETEVTWCCHGQLIYSMCLLQHNWIPIFQTNVWLLWHNVINFMVFSSFAPIIGTIKSNLIS